MAAFTRCFTTGSRFVISGRLLAFRLRNEAESGSLALRLACSPHKFPPDELLHPTLASATCRTGNLHGELLSVHKIKPGLSWRTGVAEEDAESQQSQRSSLRLPPRLSVSASKKCLGLCYNVFVLPGYSGSPNVPSCQRVGAAKDSFRRDFRAGTDRFHG